MKATIERATLLRSLGHVQSVVERRNTIPILSNVLVEASEGGGLRLMATDLDLQIVETVEANVTQPGATTVSAHTLFDIASRFGVPFASLRSYLDRWEEKGLVRLHPLETLIPPAGAPGGAGAPEGRSAR